MNPRETLTEQHTVRFAKPDNNRLLKAAKQRKQWVAELIREATLEFIQQQEKQQHKNGTTEKESPRRTVGRTATDAR